MECLLLHVNSLLVSESSQNRRRLRRGRPVLLQASAFVLCAVVLATSAASRYLHGFPNKTGFEKNSFTCAKFGETKLAELSRPSRLPKVSAERRQVVGVASGASFCSCAFMSSCPRSSFLRKVYLSSAPLLDRLVPSASARRYLPQSLACKAVPCRSPFSLLNFACTPGLCFVSGIPVRGLSRAPASSHITSFVQQSSLSRAIGDFQRHLSSKTPLALSTMNGQPSGEMQALLQFAEEARKNGWSSKDVREIYIRFFELHGHLRYPSSPVVPHGDNTLLFINAGEELLVSPSLPAPLSPREMRS